jgi:hypothetical protein
VKLVRCWASTPGSRVRRVAVQRRLPGRTCNKEQDAYGNLVADALRVCDRPAVSSSPTPPAYGRLYAAG